MHAMFNAHMNSTSTPYICTLCRDKSILLLFPPIILPGNSFFLPIMLKILLKVFQYFAPH